MWSFKVKLLLLCELRAQYSATQYSDGQLTGEAVQSRAKLAVTAPLHWDYKGLGFSMHPHMWRAT